MPEDIHCIWHIWMMRYAILLSRKSIYTKKDGTMPSKKKVEIAVDRENGEQIFSNTAIGDKISFQ